MSSHYYFAYGSNMNPDRMLARGLSYTHACLGILRHYQLAFNKRAADAPGRAYANVRFALNGVTEGVLYRLQDQHEIQKMDPFEGTPRFYSRDIFTIETSQGVIPAWVYIANPAMIADDVLPESWYLQHLLAGRPYLSAAYLESLQQVPCHPTESDLR